MVKSDETSRTSNIWLIVNKQTEWAKQDGYSINCFNREFLKITVAQYLIKQTHPRPRAATMAESLPNALDWPTEAENRTVRSAFDIDEDDAKHQVLMVNYKLLMRKCAADNSMKQSLSETTALRPTIDDINKTINITGSVGVLLVDRAKLSSCNASSRYEVAGCVLQVYFPRFLNSAASQLFAHILGYAHATIEGVKRDVSKGVKSVSIGSRFSMQNHRDGELDGLGNHVSLGESKVTLHPLLDPQLVSKFPTAVPSTAAEVVSRINKDLGVDQEQQEKKKGVSSSNRKKSLLDARDVAKLCAVVATFIHVFLKRNNLSRILLEERVEATVDKLVKEQLKTACDTASFKFPFLGINNYFTNMSFTMSSFVNLHQDINDLKRALSAIWWLTFGRHVQGNEFVVQRLTSIEAQDGDLVLLDTRRLIHGTAPVSEDFDTATGFRIGSSLQVHERYFTRCVKTSTLPQEILQGVQEEVNKRHTNNSRKRKPESMNHQEAKRYGDATAKLVAASNFAAKPILYHRTYDELKDFARKHGVDENLIVQYLR